MYNNPAFQMFLMATLDRYWARKPELRWPAGVDNMLIVSVGTGTSPDVRAGLQPEQMNLLFNATTIPSALMFAALNEQDLLCRIFGELSCWRSDRCRTWRSDRGVGPLGPQQKLFTYIRYNTELTRAGLDRLGCRELSPEVVQKMDLSTLFPTS